MTEAGTNSQAVKELESKHGITKLDIVIANAAINVTGAEFKDLDLDDWEATMNVNVSGPSLRIWLCIYHHLLYPALPSTSIARTPELSR